MGLRAWGSGGTLTAPKVPRGIFGFGHRGSKIPGNQLKITLVSRRENTRGAEAAAGIVGNLGIVEPES